jgi:hypothetical protein
MWETRPPKTLSLGGVPAILLRHPQNYVNGQPDKYRMAGGHGEFIGQKSKGTFNR